MNTVTLCRAAFLTALLLGTASHTTVAEDASSSEAVKEKTATQKTETQKTVPEADEAAPPEWFVNHLKTMTESNGRWIANNSAHRSDAEPFDSYGMAWRWGLGKKSATSRLFVVRGGEDLGTLWEHRTVWHPGEKRAMTYSFGSDGSHGVGTLESVDDNEIKLEQEFFGPDGSTYRTGHRVIDLGQGEVKMQSFGITPDGNWEPQRTYVWKLEEAEVEKKEEAVN